MIEMMAVMPFRMTAPRTAACGDAPKPIIVTPEIAIMTIMIAVPMPS